MTIAKIPKAILPLVVAVVGLLWAPAVRAQCGISLPFGDFGGSYMMNCADGAPVDALVAAFGASGTTGLSNVVCESQAELNNQGGGCQVAAGVVGDGKITINGDFSNPGALGTCPDPNQVTGTGRNVYAVRDSQGHGVIISVGYNTNLGVYDLDAAHKEIPGSPTHDPAPLQCSPKGTMVDPNTLIELATGSQNLTLDSLAPGPPPMANVTLRHPQVFSDCDPDSVGMLKNTGSCDPATEVGGVVQSSGNIYITTGDCGGVLPTRGLCNGGAKAGQPCSVNLDCGASLVACVNRWAAGPVLDPLSLPASTSIPLPTSACVGGNNPGLPCTTASACAGRCQGGTRDNFSCTLTSITGTCQGRCVGGTNPGVQCAAAATCLGGGVCTAWPCALGTCSPLTQLANQCVYLGSTFAFNGSESTSIMSTPAVFSGGGPGAPPARALDVTAVVSGGEIMIHFRTAAELQLVGFNVLTETKAKGQFKVNDSLIAPRGVGGGGATYDNVPIARGKFQGGRTVIIESVLTDSTTLRSDAVRF